jgi:hypothetical protein
LKLIGSGSRRGSATEPPSRLASRKLAQRGLQRALEHILCIQLGRLAHQGATEVAGYDDGAAARKTTVEALDDLESASEARPVEWAPARQLEIHERQIQVVDFVERSRGLRDVVRVQDVPIGPEGRRDHVTRKPFVVFDDEDGAAVCRGARIDRAHGWSIADRCADCTS